MEDDRTDRVAKLMYELQLATLVIKEKDREMEMYRRRETALTDECKCYKSTIRRLTESDNYQSVLVESSLHKEHSDEQLEMSQSSLEEVTKSLETEKDEVEVSESKKVRLEASSDTSCLSRRLEILENENKRLNVELQSLRESKESVEAKIEVLEADKVRLEIELVKERSRNFVSHDSSSSSSESREKDMNASVAVLSEPVSRRDAATSPKPQHPCCCATCLTQIQRKVKETAEKLEKLGHITVTSCNPGDNVLLFWDPTYETYTLYQESKTLHFLNSSCIDGLDLNLNAGKISANTQTIVQIVDKQFCHARKVKSLLYLSCVYLSTRLIVDVS